eukprot:scaffold7075_cov274-Pinguiococcus_pyrenoidosus.AAC.19
MRTQVDGESESEVLWMSVPGVCGSVEGHVKSGWSMTQNSSFSTYTPTYTLVRPFHHDPPFLLLLIRLQSQKDGTS